MPMSKLLAFNLFVRQAGLFPLASPFLPPVGKVEKGYSYAAGQKMGTLEVGGGYGLAKTGQTVVYRTGDDGTYKKGKPLTGARYTDPGNGTIQDNGTGLMWPKDGNGAACNNGTGIAWNGAIDFCEALNFAGHLDWRMPNIKELHTLLNYERTTPMIGEAADEAPFVNTFAGYYWSSTTVQADITKAWYISFADAAAGKGGISTAYKVRPVRNT